MRFAIVTPSFNRTKYLDDTIRSVVTQQGNFEIDYLIQDGGSNNDVIDILKHWENEIKTNRFIPQCRRLKFQWECVKDNGMYDAINRGFAKISGNVMAWINSDDMYHSYAFETIVNILSQYEDVHWITGIPNSYNEHGSKAGMDLFPAAYSRDFISRGYYNAKFLRYGFNWVQQESTFWRSDLWRKVGGRLDEEKTFAADFYLWKDFAKHTDLVKVYSLLGGYRCHGEQLTSDPNNYSKELDLVERPPVGLLVLRVILVNMPFMRRVIFSKQSRNIFLKLLGLQRDWLVGRIVKWSYIDKKWILTHKEAV